MKNNLNVNIRQLNEQTIPSDLVYLEIKPKDLTEQELIKFLFDVKWFSTRNKWNDEVILVSQNDLIIFGLDFKFSPFDNYSSQIISEVNSVSKGYSDWDWFNTNYPLA
jgi:hypothetical protein